ncbi:Mis12-Mtw1 protein family-domain-containing protein [Collybia nuda]|uniref:Mis12-Mtw1 protein family-domain-containing protein n=1 Tax=Collybia nuda TaxID=64659 RepID=A0A9P5Y081_9AGAR|nr:Mis12-Mtw1 protein family-domain-containing protein [Collybia nuda]
MTSIVTQMFPSQSQPSAKRKAQDDNPLLNAAKRAKKEAKAGASNKRKLLNAEEQPGGLLIVRAPNATPRLSSAPPSSQPHHPPSSQSQRLPSSSGAGPSKQPSKKFRADSQPPTSKLKPSARARNVLSPSHDDSEIEQDVRAMEDEADHLRRNSRAHTTINPTLIPSISPEFHFPARPPDPGSPRKRKTKITDTSVPLPQEETPQIERNKLLRGGAMAAIGNGWPDNSGGGGGHRRKSSINSRGKRISNTFETTGIITHPHNSVSDSSFYKHIDCDLPDAERVRQLLIWCSLRAASRSPGSSQKEEPPQPLPPLSAQGSQLLKSVQEDVVKMLAERRIDLSMHPPEASSSTATEPQKENEQNITNRGWEVTYGNHIQGAMEEDEAWKKVGYTYDAYIKKARATLDKQTAPSAKAKGKQRAMEEEEAVWKPREHELSESFQRGVTLSKSVLGLRPGNDERVVGSSRRSSVGLGLGGLELEAELERRMSEVEFKLDQLRTFANAARTTTNMAEQALDQRFALLSLNLSARSNPPIALHDLGPTSGVQVLSTYVPRVATEPDPMDLMRALARVDKDRPPAMVGDAARRAAREVQRVGESGIGERRLTGVPPPNLSQTPRKTPGTPRRGGTPARDRER